jgi:cytosine/adenosine deaminase-related metal-dependent hydrolase
MTHSSAPISLRARWVFPVDQPPIDGGVVVIDGERIVAVGRNVETGVVRDLGDVAILPGLVNAHTHLEFSDLTEPIGEPGMAFPDWIREVVSRRRAMDPVAAEIAAVAAIHKGLAECVTHGVTTLGEIGRVGWWDLSLRRPTIDVTVFYELLGLAKARVDELHDAACRALDVPNTSDATWHGALSPHAPYSVHPSALDRLMHLSVKAQVPVAMHLAESPEELELLASHSGPFRELLQTFGAWDESAISPGTRPLDYLRTLARAARSLVIHGNYFDDEEIQFAAENRDRMSVVYCPRTHAYFDHKPYPLAKMHHAGVRVALGTDSRASSPDLSLLAEMRHVAAIHSDVSPADVLRMGTLSGAESLGQAKETGSLTPGKRADLAIVPLGDSSDHEPLERVFYSEHRVHETWRLGRQISSET